MLIQEKSLAHWIDNFYGYGSWKANIWLVSLEEPGGDTPEEVAEKLEHFRKTHPTLTPQLCDMRDMYRNVTFRDEGPKASVYKNLYDYRFGSKAIQHGGWKNLILFTHRYIGIKQSDPFKYQQKSFAAANSLEALIPLYPLPSTHNHAWYYSWLQLPSDFNFLKSRTAYQDQLYPKRIKTILQNISIHQPRLVLLYGMTNIALLKKSVLSFFPETKFVQVNAIPQLIPQHHRASLSPTTTLVITTQVPTLRHNRIETGFDWQKFANVIKSGK